MQGETEDLRLRTLSVLSSLSEEQLLLVLAQCLRDRESVRASGLEDLLEETA